MIAVMAVKVVKVQKVFFTILRKFNKNKFNPKAIEKHQESGLKRKNKEQ